MEWLEKKKERMKWKKKEYLLRNMISVSLTPNYHKILKMNKLHYNQYDVPIVRYLLRANQPLTTACSLDAALWITISLLLASSIQPINIKLAHWMWFSDTSKEQRLSLSTIFLFFCFQVLLNQLTSTCQLLFRKYNFAGLHDGPFNWKLKSLVYNRVNYLWITVKPKINKVPLFAISLSASRHSKTLPNQTT